MYLIYAIIVVIVSLVLVVPTFGLSLIAPFALVNWGYVIGLVATKNDD